MEMPLITELFLNAKAALGDYLKFATIAFILFYFLLKKPLWFRKIQPKMPKLSDYRRDVLYSMLTVAIIAVFSTLTFNYLRAYTNLYDDISEYGIAYYAFSSLWIFFLHDTYFYWTHRAIHHPKLFKQVHLLHHKSHNPSPWTAYALHPLEAILEAAFLPLMAFTLPLHTGLVSLYFVVFIIYNVYLHLGFELFPKGFHKTWIGRYFNTSVSHNLHHDKFHGNYGLYFLFWDRLMGTVREDYDTVYEKTTDGEIDLSFLSKQKRERLL